MGKIVVDLQLPPTASQVALTHVPLSRVKAPPQKSIFVQESPNELKFWEYANTSPE